MKIKIDISEETDEAEEICRVSLVEERWVFNPKARFRLSYSIQ